MVTGSNAKTIMTFDAIRPYVRSFDFSLTEMLNHGDVCSEHPLPGGIDERIPIRPDFLGDLTTGEPLIPVLKSGL